MLRRSTILLTLATAFVVALAGPAGAHVEVGPAEALAGTTQTLTFSVAYEGAATTGLDVQLPSGAAVVDVPDKAGWESEIGTGGSTVKWSGGSVSTDDTFAVQVALPATPGEVLFPAIQQTTDGEVAWISEDEEEGHGGERPAPRLTLLPNPDATTTTSAPTTTTTVAPSTTTTNDLPGTTLEAAEQEGGSAAPWLIGGGIAALLAIAVGGTLLKRRTDGDAAPPAGDDDPPADD